jgi:hypothetical protein
MLGFLKKVIRKTLSFIRRVLGIRNSRELDFQSIIYSEDVGLDPQLVYRSSPSGNSYLENLLSDLNIDKSDSIIDIGSGKGSALRVMMRFPFSKIAGIEISLHIANISKRNFKILKAKNIIIYSSDARYFKKYSEFNIFYFYNPFPAQIMKDVVVNIFNSTSHLDKEIIIIYNNPTCHSEVIAYTNFKKLSEYPDQWGNKIFIYSNRDIAASRVTPRHALRSK